MDNNNGWLLLWMVMGGELYCIVLVTIYSINDNDVGWLLWMGMVIDGDDDGWWWGWMIIIYGDDGGWYLKNIWCTALNDDDGKWSVVSECFSFQEYQEDKRDLVISNAERNQTIYVYQCKNVTLQVKGKCNAIFVGQ